jgi:hypothetical protein
MQIIYLNDYYEKEEAVIKAYGISCARVSYPFQESEIEIQGTPIFRGPKMKVAAYSEFIQSLEKIGCSALVGLDDFVRISDAIEYTRCFGSYAPKVITFDIKQGVEEISNLLIKSDLNYPLFVRSDIESAAKYVGVDACTLRSSDGNDIEMVLEPIYKYIKNAGTIIMKEIVSVKKINGKTIEYRAIVVNGKIICFDYDSSSDLPCPESLSCAWQFEDCINTASKNGLQGAYFVDFGVDEKDNLFVVECKNIINGTIKNINAFAEGLAKMRKV